MIFRRIKAHVAKEDWFAVFIDFLIVVFGVFMGFQVTNWNETRSEKSEYELAVSRYRAELKSNLELLDLADRDVINRFKVVDAGYNALLSCQDSQENRALIERAALQLQGTVGLNLHDNALRGLTEIPSLLSQQTEEERQSFAATKYKMRVFLGEAKYSEDAPHIDMVQNNPLFVEGGITKRVSSIVGIEISPRRRELKLSVPVSVACTDNELRKSFYTWERWQSLIPSVSNVLRTELESSLKRLEE